MPETSKFIIRNLELYTPIVSKNRDSGTYSISKQESDRFPIDNFSHFPVLIDEKGLPWPPANLYLLSKLENINTPNPKTLESIANDLVTFQRFLLFENLAYDCFPKRKLSRPTYRYRAYLVAKVKNGTMSANTAKRKISSVVGFYRWLQNQPNIKLGYPAWNESERFISFQDEYGFTQAKRVRQTDISLNLMSPKNIEEINDGGKLKPLTKNEQQQLAYALKAIGNTEMTLIFLVALTSGARIQTVCTLRFSILNSHQCQSGLYIIHAGGKTLIDTKLNKPIILLLPVWVMDKLKVYANSLRSKRRCDLSSHYPDDKQSQYLFLTKSGKPYYVSEKDPQIKSYRHPPKGDAVRQFIKTSIAREMSKSKRTFQFRFHDLRATFGLNLIEDLLNQLNGGDISRFDLLMIVKERMGHSRLETTEGYLNYRIHNKLLIETQSEYELFLKGLIDG
ncbi:site-specific integrase [Shewanella sp. 4t3-1-2LB]|uniref:tyrosine-type recombinase/integrase n=1 Tax=Shewanella sp. 4t3-1-2LB TaxID=2817682 RepID=UPI001A991C9D|nr:site-specific integrase [Shewanella sp. 4t3-1-2LB]MBO1271134.1 site-specific integrase [Shewanella sp. 4t3-1-2LB]